MQEHGWAKDRADPHAREHALDIASQEPPDGLSPDQAVAEVREVLDSIGDTCRRVSVGDVPGYSSVLLRSPNILR